MLTILEQCKIRTIFVPIYEDEDEGNVVSWKEIVVAYVTVLPTYFLSPSGDMEPMNTLCLVCFDKNADDKILIKIFVEVDEFKIGKYEINEFRRRSYSAKNREKTNRTGSRT